MQIRVIIFIKGNFIPFIKLEFSVLSIKQVISVLIVNFKVWHVYIVFNIWLLRSLSYLIKKVS